MTTPLSKNDKISIKKSLCCTLYAAKTNLHFRHRHFHIGMPLKIDFDFFGQSMRTFYSTPRSMREPHFSTPIPWRVTRALIEVSNRMLSEKSKSIFNTEPEKSGSLESKAWTTLRWGYPEHFIACENIFKKCQKIFVIRQPKISIIVDKLYHLFLQHHQLGTRYDLIFLDGQ